MSTVKIGCRLPFGIMLDDVRDPGNHKKRVKIKGLVDSETRIHIPDHLRSRTSPFDFEAAVVTEIDEGFWNGWAAVHATTFEPYLLKMFYVVKSEGDAVRVARDGDKTGFEPIDPSKEYDVSGMLVAVDDQRGA